MKKNRIIVAMTVALFLVAAIAPQVQAEKYKKEYKLQLNVGPTFYWGMGAAKFAELCKKYTNGRINVKPYYGSALLKGANSNLLRWWPKVLLTSPWSLLSTFHR
jgi:TRAP-type C4-dicarboxylate transport system substrate-binding protein